MKKYFILLITLLFFSNITFATNNQPNIMLADAQSEKELEYLHQLVKQQQAMQEQMIRQQNFQNALRAIQQMNQYQQQQEANKIREYEIYQKYNAPAFRPTYDVNLNHNIRYHGY